MRSKFGVYILFILLLVLGSCSSSKNVTYFQSSKSRKGEVVDLPSYRNSNTVRFRPDDILGITVHVPAQQVVASDYNLPLTSGVTPGMIGSSTSQIGQSSPQSTYQIRKDGTIDFPGIGNIKVAGYTQEELENYIKQRIAERVKVPTIVNVSFLNFTFTILGEVSSPGKKVVERDNINLFDALSLAGDMTIFGIRDDVELWRETPDGGYKVISLDISKEEIISSPYFFLQQNDRLYIKPNKGKSQQADSPRLNYIFSIVSFSISMLSFALMISKL